MSKSSQLGLFEASRQPKAALKITSPSIQAKVAKVKVQPEVRLES